MPPPKREIPVTANWSPHRSRGRARKRFVKAHLDHHPVSQWAAACLVPEPRAAEFVGHAHATKSREVNPRKTYALPTYPRPTLMESYVEWCPDHGYPHKKPRTFGALVVKTLLEQGHPAYLDRSSDARRIIVRGAALRGQSVWIGEDRGAYGNDRRRWEKKS